MATSILNIEAQVRHHLIEPIEDFWSQDELHSITRAGIRDLWRASVDLKQEYYLIINRLDVFIAASATEMSGIPADVHKVYLIEPRDVTSTGSHPRLVFTPLDYNHDVFASARSNSGIDPTTGGEIFYAITGPGAPVGAPTITIAPTVTAVVQLAFSYVPTLGPLIDPKAAIPIPGEADNALIAWTVAFARAKEREDRSPDPSWLAVYSTEKQNLLQSLGIRQFQEPTIVDGIFAELW